MQGAGIAGLHTYTGWVIVQGNLQFLSASGAIGAHGVNPDVTVDLGDNYLGKYELPAPPTDHRAIQNAITATLDFLHVGVRSVTGILWAAMYAAPFTDIAPLNAVLWVYGPTQSGKSTITMLALSHYGKDFIQKRDYHAPVDWTSTATALEGAMFTIKDAPIVIDDFAPQFASSGDARDMHRKAAYIIRSVGNRSSRGRARADLSQQRTRIPRGLVIATAENPIVGQSTVGRIIYVNVAPDDVLPESAEKPLSVLQEKAQNGYMAQAMTLYIQALAGNRQKYAAEFLSTANAQSEWFRSMYDVQSRLPDYFGVLDAGQILALKVFQQIGGFSEEYVRAIAEENRTALVEIILNQAEKILEEAPVQKFFEALGSFVEDKSGYFAPRIGSVPFTPPLNSHLIGYFEPGQPHLLYVRLKSALGLAKKFWASMDENLDMRVDAMRRQISQVPGLLFEQDQRQVEVSKRCAGGNQRVLAVDARIVEKLYHVSLTKDEIPAE